MAASVFYAPARGKPRRNKFDRITAIIEKAGLAAAFPEDSLVAVKVHWGELGNADFIPSFYVKHIVSLLLHHKTRPFITDTNTLYHGARHNGVDNLLAAAANGFTEATLGAPVIVADGLRGLDYREVPAGPSASHVSNARIAGAIADADGIVAVSHVKGHMLFGFGGALKNIGMGCAAGAAKQSLHSDIRPKVKESRCTGCGDCVQHCAFAAIVLSPGQRSGSGSQACTRHPERSRPSGTKARRLPPAVERRTSGSLGKVVARIDPNRCQGCGECVVVCRKHAIPIDWEGDVRTTQEKTAEYAGAALRGKKALFVNFLVSVTPDCDCCDWSDAPIVPDVGFLASTDPVAIDMASVDLVNSFEGYPDRFAVPRSGDRFRTAHDVDYMPLLRHAEALGLGSLAYDLIQVD